MTWLHALVAGCFVVLAVNEGLAQSEFISGFEGAGQRPRGADGLPPPARVVILPDKSHPFLHDRIESIWQILSDGIDWTRAAEGDVVRPPWTGNSKRLAAALDLAEREVAARYGTASREMMTFIASTLDAAFRARGDEAALVDAMWAVENERLLTASAVFHDMWFVGAEAGLEPADDVIGGRGGVVRGNLLAYVRLLYEEALAENDGVRAREMARAGFRLLQYGFVSPAAELATRRMRLNPELPPAELARNRLVLETKRLMDETGPVRFGGGRPDPDTVAFLEDLGELAGDDRVRRFVGMFGDRMHRIEAGLDAIRDGGVEIAGVVLPDVLDMSAVQSTLTPEEVLIAQGDGGGRQQVFVLTAQRLFWFQSEAGVGEIAVQVEALIGSLNARSGRSATALAGRRSSDPGRTVAASRWLYDQILAPAEHLLRGKTRYLVAGHGPARVTRVPFPVLLRRDPEPGVDWNRMDFLVRHATVTVLPTVEYVLARKAGSGRPPIYLGFADPDFRRKVDAGFSITFAMDYSHMLKRLGRLPETRGEIGKIAELFPPESAYLRMGRAASESELYALSRSGSLRTVTVIHFATHGLVTDEEEKLFTSAFLALTPEAQTDFLKAHEPERLFGPTLDGALTDREIGYLDVDAELVILSACNTATAQPFDDGGAGGLSAAFLGAGAHRVLATHWEVDSDGAVALVTGLMANDPDLADPAEALRLTMLSQLDAGDRRAHPAYWGAFSVMGAR